MIASRMLAVLVVAGLTVSALALAGCQAPPVPIAAPSVPVISEGLESDRPLATAEPALTNAELRAIIDRLELTGDPSLGRDLPGIEEPLAQLGMNLFFSKAVGGDMDSACVSCHHPLLGGGDALPVSIGVGADDPDLLGPGRTHPSGRMTVPRNAPTTFNIALWDQVLFFDGRVESLGKTPGRNGNDGLGIHTPDSLYGEADPAAGDDMVAAQSRFPITSPEEMRGFTFERHKPNSDVRLRLCERLGAFGDANGELAGRSWIEEFARVFGETDDPELLVTDASIAAALAAYQRSQVFVDTPWRAYVQGDATAIDAAAKRGALLFFEPIEAGGTDCASCHSGDFFSDEQFYVLAVPQVGPGKDDGINHDDDYGRFRETGRAEDLYAFRTPTLLNVEVTGPYSHDGTYATLEGIIRHHLDPAAAVAAYDPGQLDPAVWTGNMAENTTRALAKLQENRRLGLPAIENVTLNEQQVADLVSFLLTLTDPCVKDPACLAPWIPGEANRDPGGLRLQAKLPSLNMN